MAFVRASFAVLALVAGISVARAEAPETYYGLPSKTWIFIAFAIAVSGALGGLSAIRDHLRRRRALRRGRNGASTDERWPR